MRNATFNPKGLLVTVAAVSVLWGALKTQTVDIADTALLVALAVVVLVSSRIAALREIRRWATSNFWNV